MSDPTRKLIEMLSAATAAKAGIDRIRGNLRDQIPASQQELSGQIEQMRSQLQQTGIGKDKDLEDAYLQALYNHRSLSQSYALREHIPTRSQQLPPDSELAKAARTAELMLAVYEGGRLVKGAALDLDSLAVQLERLGDRKLAERLMSCAKRSRYSQ
jgi:hypothetical protein